MVDTRDDGSQGSEGNQKHEEECTGLQIFLDVVEKGDGVGRWGGGDEVVKMFSSRWRGRQVSEMRAVLARDFFSLPFAVCGKEQKKRK